MNCKVTVKRKNTFTLRAPLFIMKWRCIYMIKQKLKNNGLTLTKFCEDFKISRPTMNSYVKLHEEGKTLSNDLFQRIFDYLFVDESKTVDEFNEKYGTVLKYYKQRIGTTDNVLAYDEHSNRNYNSLLLTLQKDMINESISDSKYEFINYVLKNNDVVVNDFIDFYLSILGIQKFNLSKRSNNKFISFTRIVLIRYSSYFLYFNIID